MADIAIIGGGPGGLVAAIALARRGIRTTVFERDAHPEQMPRFNPDRSYAIDITGHGLRALRHIDALDHFDAAMIPFRGIKFRGRTADRWSEPGWIGSRGDILRALMSVIDDRHRDLIDFEFGSAVNTLDVHTGDVDGRRFDLVIGADGAGSTVRTAMQQQLDGFTVETSYIPNYAIMIELDRVGDQLDQQFLNVLDVNPFLIAGAIIDHDKPAGVRWLCMLGVGEPTTFASAEEAASWLRKKSPRVLELASEQAIAEFSQRECHQLGRRLSCSHLSGGKAVLLGDAAAAFPPIGQGVNAAMESAIVLDQCLAVEPPETAAARYEAVWKPEADAISWIGERMLFKKPWGSPRQMITFLFGLRAVGEAKSAASTYVEAQRIARRPVPATNGQ